MTTTMIPISVDAPRLLDVQLHTGDGFFDAFGGDVAACGRGERISLATMSMDPEEPPAALLIDRLCDAAARGARVALAIDAYTLFYPRRIGPLLAPRGWARGPSRGRVAAITQLRRAGVACAIVNEHGGGPLRMYSGRSHLKIATVGERAFIGGPSLHGCDGLDLVVALTDPQVCDRLYRLVAAIVRATDTVAILGRGDQAWSLDDRTQLLLDAGVPGQSLIMARALHVIATARENLTITCQYFPTGVLAHRLHAAHRRGVAVHIAFNHPSRHDQLAGVHRLILAAARLRRPRVFFAHQVSVDFPKLHAKAIASENTAMVGSHNLAAVGVRLGTSEIAVLRADPVFARAVRAAVLEQTIQPRVVGDDRLALHGTAT
ncbi:MAG TPA: phospholipase D-like domain-containing protein [Micromonosporaceae bacterium]|jgi:phosphatidylserine/phosphatidylglycerophosphate/cardiolipin synthase-like enzyme